MSTYLDMEDILIIKPNGSNTYQDSLKELKAIEPPLWQVVLASRLNSGYLIDAEAENFDDIEVLTEVEEVGAPDVIILCSGNHPSAYIQQRDNMIKLDILLNKMQYKVKCHSTLFFNPCEVAEINWDLIDFNDYRAHNWHSWTNNCDRSPYATLFTSISCPFKCEFCCIKSFYGEKYHERPLEYIYKDLDYFAKKHIKNIKIMDELFVFKRERVLEICNYIINKGYKFNIWAYARIDIMDAQLLETMKKAGINWLAYGIESGNDEIRKEVLKGSFDKNKIRDIVHLTQDYGISVLGNFMFGFRNDTMETMQETLDFAKELNCEFINFYNVVAYPGSQLYEDMIKEGIPLPTSWAQYSQLSEDFLPLPTKTVKCKEVIEFRDKAFNEYFDDRYFKMMQNKFGDKVVDDIRKMLSVKIKRK